MTIRFFAMLSLVLSGLLLLSIAPVSATAASAEAITTPTVTTTTTSTTTITVSTATTTVTQGCTGIDVIATETSLVTTTRLVTETNSIVPNWAYGVMAALLIVGLAIGYVVRRPSPKP
jgi:hypothetical protein